MIDLLKTKKNNMILNIEKVLEFQKKFDTVGDSLNQLDSNLRVDLLSEEVRELNDAFSNHQNPNYKEVLDAYCDIIFLAIGGAIKHGFKDVLSQAFEIVCDSNLSKADASYQDAMKTQELYAKKGIRTEIAERNNDGEEYFLTLRQSDGKVLKSYKYKEVDFTEILNTIQ